MAAGSVVATAEKHDRNQREQLHSFIVSTINQGRKGDGIGFVKITTDGV
jgi:hypothetical protein